MKINFPADTTLTFVRLTLQDAVRRPSKIDLADDEVHVWGILLECEGDVVQALGQTLSAEERARIDRLVSDQHRDQRVITYRALRVVLSWYEACDPRALRFERTPQGKPVLLRPDGGGEPVRFNLTHSHGRALIAVARAREVGIDLEKVRPERNVTSLANRFLSLEEQRAIERAAPEARPERFVQMWVAREAALKAIGTGLTFPLDQSYVDMSADASEGRLVRRSPDCVDSGCMIRLLPVEAGWMAAVATRGKDWRIKLCRGSEA